MVECQLPKLDVVGSSPISRSISFQSLRYECSSEKSELPYKRPLNGVKRSADPVKHWL